MAAQMRKIPADGEIRYSGGGQVRPHRAFLQRHVGSRPPLDREGIPESIGCEDALKLVVITP